MKQSIWIAIVVLVGCRKYDLVNFSPKISLHQRLIDSICPSLDCTVTAYYPEYNHNEEWEIKTKNGDSSYFLDYILWDCMDGETLYDSNLYYISGYIVWKDYTIWKKEHEHLFDINP